MNDYPYQEKNQQPAHHIVWICSSFFTSIHSSSILLLCGVMTPEWKFNGYFYRHLLWIPSKEGDIKSLFIVDEEQWTLYDCLLCGPYFMINVHTFHYSVSFWVCTRRCLSWLMWNNKQNHVFLLFLSPDIFTEQNARYTFPKTMWFTNKCAWLEQKPGILYFVCSCL